MKKIIITFCFLSFIGAYASGDEDRRQLRALADAQAKADFEIQNKIAEITRLLDESSSQFNAAFRDIQNGMYKDKKNCERNLNQCIEQCNRQNSQQ